MTTNNETSTKAAPDRRTKVARMTLLGMLTAILIVLGYVNIPMPAGLSITFNMIPVAVAAIAMGVPGGLAIGTVFGLISFAQCFNVFGSSQLGTILLNQTYEMYKSQGYALWQAALFSGAIMFVQRVLSRTLVGLVTALIYRGLRKTRLPLSVKGTITGFSAAFSNTIFFMSSLVLLFSQTGKMQENMAGKGFFAYLFASVGVNAVTEMIVAAVVTGAAIVALKKARLITA